MFKKYLTLTMSVLVLNLAFGSTAFGGTTNEEKAAKQAEKVKANVTKLGTGKDARVEVKLKDGTKLKGYVSQINENSFVVMNEKTATPTEVPYPNAKQVRGHNLSNGVKFAIAIGLIVGLIALLIVAGRSD